MPKPSDKVVAEHEELKKVCLRMAEGIDKIANHDRTCAFVMKLNPSIILKSGIDDMSSMYLKTTAQEIQKETADIVNRLRGGE